MSAKGSSDDNNAQSKLTIDENQMVPTMNQAAISGNVDVKAKNNVVRVYKEESLNNPEASWAATPYFSVKETLYAQRESIKNEEQKEEEDFDELQEMMNELRLVIRDSIEKGNVLRQKINAKLRR